MSKIININGETTCRTIIVLNSDVIISLAEELDMEETFFHTKFLDNRFPILAKFGIHILEYIVRIVHLINHEIKRCIGVVKGC